MNDGNEQNATVDSGLDGHSPVLDELKKIRQELCRLNANPLLQIQPSIFKTLVFQFFKGVFLGFGSFIGATIVVSILVYLLSNIEFVPIIGDVVKKILLEIKQ